MTSSIKLENNQNKQQRFHQQQQQHAAMVKNLHLSEVITTAPTPYVHHHNNPTTTHRHSTIDPIEMTKLLSNITTTSTSSSLKPTSKSPTMDYSSQLNQFSWEEIEGRYVPVIYRTENGLCQRYTSKMYVENTLFQSESWQKHSLIARSLPPLVSYTYTENELRLLRSIVTWHLASFYFKTIPSTDCLIRFEDLLDFYNTLRKLRDTNLATPTITFNRPIAPIPPPKSESFELPTSTLKQRTKVPVDEKPHSKESGWVQINNVFVPYIIKVKLRENELNKCHTRQPAPQLQREFYVPYEILIKCNIFSDTEFLFKKFLIKATQDDFDILNNLITNINIFDEKVPEKTLLVNLYHVMIGLNRILYIKFLPTKQPRTQVNKYHADVLIHKGGTLLMNGNKLIPYIVQNNRFYVPLLYTFHSLPNILLQAKRGARAPRQYEIDYLNLLFIYFSIDIPPLTSDTLLVDIFNIKCSNLQTPIHFRTLHEHQQYEKNKLLNAIIRTTTPKSSTSSSSSSSTTHKTNKCPPANVVVNPMIHHPSFYGLTSPKPVLPLKQPEIKSIMFDNHSLNAIAKLSDTLPDDWKISVKEIFEKFSFDIDYEKFLQWCQANLLLPLIKLDDEENKINHDNNDYYIYQRHLDRCISLLNDLKRGSISMTLLPSSNNPSQQIIVKSSLAGAKKRKMAMPTTRHILPVSTNNELNPVSNSVSEDIEYSSSEEPTLSVTNNVPIESLNDEIPSSIITDNNNNNNDDDIMPVVASVEEEQSIEDPIQTQIDPTFVIVESTDCSDEKIQLDDKIPSCSSGYESSTVLTNIDNHIHEDNDGGGGGDDDDGATSTIRSREHSSSCQSTISPDSPKITSTNQKKVNKKRQRNPYGKSRARSRSSAARSVKKQRPIVDDNNDDDQSSLIVIITSEKIQQHLKTLFMVPNESRRTRTRPVKMPARLVEEINPSNNNNAIKPIEPDTNVFDILSSSTTIDNTESTENSHQSCTYNVVISSQPNKLGLTIKKVVPSELNN